MKKKICTLLTLCLLLSSLSVLSLSAESSVADSLVIHWDFEGNSLDEQLSNKAKNGSENDRLTLTTAEGKSTVKNGVAHISHEPTEYLSMTTSKTDQIGTNLINLKEATVFVRWKMSGEISTTTGNCTPICLNHTSNVAKALYARGYINAGTNQFVLKMNNNGSTGIYLPDNTIAPDSYISMAITYRYDESKGYTVTLYASDCDWQDGSAGNQMSLTIPTESFNGSLWVNASQLLFGKMANQIGAGKADCGADFWFDDIRIYNTALTENEIKTLSPIHINGIQLPANVSEEDDVISPRLVTSICGLNYQSAGYVLSLSNSSPYIGGEHVTQYQTKTVYSTLQADGEDITSTDDWYYIAVVIRDIPKSAYSQTIYLRPYAITPDGTVVYGDQVSFCVSELLQAK